MPTLLILMIVGAAGFFFFTAARAAAKFVAPSGDHETSLARAIDGVLAAAAAGRCERSMTEAA